MYLADTNLLIHYIRGDRLARQVEAEYGLLSDTAARPIVSVVSEAELRTLARTFGWGPQKCSDVERLLSYFDIVPIPFASIIEAYVDVADFSRRSGRAMGKNDVWIAATSLVTGAILLTTDRDFDHLDPLLLTRRWIDPAASGRDA